MRDVSVLLNFTSRIAYEETDPLMSLVNVKEPLLFYARLSVERFPSDKELYLEHSERLVSNLRNLLEARSLSLTDDDGRIRVIIILDLVEGIFQPEGSSRFFPAQKVRAIKELIVRVFGKDNTILGRMEYSFIFINSSADDKRFSLFYQQLAYDGCTGGDAQVWFNSSDFRLNERRDALFGQLESPDIDLSIDDPSISPVVCQFTDYYQEVVGKLGPKMDETGAGDAFRDLLREATARIKTVGDFENFDYDGAVRSCVSQLIGLKANDFYTDCVFFILKYDESPASVKLKDEVFVKSLVQLLCTISSADYVQYFKTNALTSARLFLLSEYVDSNIDAESLTAFGNQVRLCLPKLSDAKWTEDMDVEYQVFTPNVSAPLESDTHREMNEKYAKQRRRLMDAFLEARPVPFFFDEKKGGWEWYSNVLERITDLYELEKENDRPLYDTPKRLTGREMSSETKKTTYRELENARIKLAKQNVPVMHVEDLNGYMVKRRELTNNLAGAINELRDELPKLGYLTCLFWIGLFSVLGFTLCFSFHFWNGSSDPLYSIAIAFGAVGLFVVLSSLIGHAVIKKKIRAVYLKIDQICNQMESKLKDYLGEVSKRSRLQKEADIRRRNLDAMEAKLDEFKSHNKRIDLWKTHFTSVSDKLGYLLTTLGKETDTSSESMKLSVDDFSLDGFPTMPLTIRSKYKAMNTQIMQVPVDIHSVTCFVKHFRFTEITPD